jgi:DNA-binding HxlR family transcriptional regulator
MGTADAGSAASTVMTRKWTIQIIAALLDGPMRFTCLERSVAGISGKVLSRRLDELQRAGLVTRTSYEEMPLRVEYALSPSGLRLEPVVAALNRWSHDERACTLMPDE